MSYYDEIEIEDMTFDPKLQIYHYPCPCGDRFEISIGDMRDGEGVGVCPSCSLMIQKRGEASNSSCGYLNAGYFSSTISSATRDLIKTKQARHI
ncbi:zf-CSL-domain-containing protein [Tothia fuscella]|uniref:Diphthamide biosynthesis protein 3 n=1 Tax=Tothia fuscella TaxID=1048955 RepID=A0A9P4NVE3_9PEZI|nr:zf-CSL-domain-containing protein [Tothia fuscella]